MDVLIKTARSAPLLIIDAIGTSHCLSSTPLLSILYEQGKTEGKIAQLVVAESPSLVANLCSLAGC
ncbi:MAG TPA: hypothetical protein VHV10_06365 [Ktedonobacteraceae bacterium]|nr:hypothetical protein [Ktedonobacteraceae bacterium]